MKRIIGVMCIAIVLVMTVTGTALAAVVPGNDILPQYISISSMMPDIEIDNNGNVAAGVSVLIKANDTLVDTVKGTLWLIDDATGRVVKTWGNVVFNGPSWANEYKFIGTHQLQTRGSYHVEATVFLYDGTALIESLNVVSRSDSY